MCASARLARVLFFLGAVAGFWLGAGQPARAGGGGSDFAAIETYIGDICTNLGISSSYCPQVPTLSQGILELAALYDSTLEAVRSQFAIPVPPYVDAANPSRPPATCAPISCSTDPLNGYTLPINTSVLSTLRPLAFVSANNSSGTAKPTQLSDPDANTFLYAVGARSSKSMVSMTQPDTLLLFYEDLNRTNQNLQAGQTVASFSLPLTVLDASGTESAASLILNYKAPNKSQLDCSASTITGMGTKLITPVATAANSISPAAIGINCAVAFGATPLSSKAHAVFEVSVPLLVTYATDYLIVYNPFGFFPGQSDNAFPDDNLGFPLGAHGSAPYIGIAPSAGPLGPAVTASSPPATYSLCAKLPMNGNGQSPVPSAAAFYAIAGNGADVFLSAPLAPTPPGIVCPAM
jgi:hypothetical protein